MQKFLLHNHRKASFRSEVRDASLFESVWDLPEFDDLFADLPFRLTQAIDNRVAIIQDVWDETFWGSKDAVQISIQVRGVQPELTERLNVLRSHRVYKTFCRKLEEAAWDYVRKQVNFSAFSAELSALAQQD